jgi:ParB-like chromosome segregation protein Spo0J
MGRADVPVIRLEHLTPAQARAFNIADNRLTETASWNDRLLGEVLTELSALDLDFSIEATGFSMAEIDLRIEGLSESPPGKADPADEQHPLAAGPVSNLAISGNSVGTGYSAGVHWSELRTRP